MEVFKYMEFIEKFNPDIKLYPWEKAILKMIDIKGKLVCCIPYRYKYPHK